MYFSDFYLVRQGELESLSSRGMVNSSLVVSALVDGDLCYLPIFVSDAAKESYAVLTARCGVRSFKKQDPAMQLTGVFENIESTIVPHTYSLKIRLPHIKVGQYKVRVTDIEQIWSSDTPDISYTPHTRQDRHRTSNTSIASYEEGDRHSSEELGYRCLAEDIKNNTVLVIVTPDEEKEILKLRGAQFYNLPSNEMKFYSDRIKEAEKLFGNKLKKSKDLWIVEAEGEIINLRKGYDERVRYLNTPVPSMVEEQESELC